MKKFLKSVLALSLVLAITFAFAGCKIIMAEGTWVCDKMRQTNSYSYNGAEIDLLQYGAYMKVVLNEDETMSISYYVPLSGLKPQDTTFEDTGKWSIDGTTIKLDGTKKDFELEWSNGKLLYRMEIPFDENNDKITATTYVDFEFSLEKK